MLRLSPESLALPPLERWLAVWTPALVALARTPRGAFAPLSVSEPGYLAASSAVLQSGETLSLLFWRQALTLPWPLGSLAQNF